MEVTAVEDKDYDEHKTNLPKYLRKYCQYRNELTVHNNIIKKEQRQREVQKFI